MVRFARIIAPGFPHHITKRGNLRQTTFFCNDDYRTYVALLQEQRAAYGVRIWGWCLMPNHVHLIALFRLMKTPCAWRLARRTRTIRDR